MFPNASFRLAILTSYRHLTTEINERRELILTLASQSNRPPSSLDSAEVFPSPGFRALTSNWHTPETDETSDELKLASGVSKSSIRYVSTSPEGWIDSASKPERSRGEVKEFGQGRPAERERENGAVGGVASGQHTWPTLLR